MEHVTSYVTDRWKDSYGYVHPGSVMVCHLKYEGRDYLRVAPDYFVGTKEKWYEYDDSTDESFFLRDSILRRELESMYQGWLLNTCV